MTVRTYVYSLERENHELKKELETATEEIKRLESLLSKQLACFNYEIDGMLVLRDTEDRVEKSLRAPTPPAIRIIREDVPPHPSPRLINEDKPSVWSIIKDAWRNFHKGITK